MGTVHRRNTPSSVEILRNFVVLQGRRWRTTVWVLLSCAVTNWSIDGLVLRHNVAVEVFQFTRSSTRRCYSGVTLCAKPSQTYLTSSPNQKCNFDVITDSITSRDGSERAVNIAPRKHPILTRSELLRVVASIGIATSSATPKDVASAFEGGIGGLGKTKPATGIVLWNEESSPILQDANTGQISAELNVAGQPVLVSYVAPWPLLSGMEARNIATAESSFVQVVENDPSTKTVVTTKSGFLELLLQTVFSSQGKFGAYAAPFDVKIVPSSFATDDSSRMMTVTANVTFTTYTPGLRESERQVLIRAVRVLGNHWILLIAGGTRQRFRAQPIEFWNDLIDSLQVALAPTSSRR